jgi:hypothetical protein
MRTLRARLVAAVELIAGGAAASVVVLACNPVNAHGSPDWMVIPGLVILMLGPVGGAEAVIVLGVWTDRKPPP